MSDDAGVGGLQRAVREFRDQRDWERFHDPKSLVLALVGEVGELAELFQWTSADEAREAFSTGRGRVRAAEEMSDVLIYLLSLANILGIDLEAAAADKLEQAQRRFPVGAASGTAPDTLEKRADGEATEW